MFDITTTFSFLGYSHHPKLLLSGYLYLDLIVGLICLRESWRQQLANNWIWVLVYWFFPPVLWYRLHHVIIISLPLMQVLNSHRFLCVVPRFFAIVAAAFLTVNALSWGSMSHFFQNHTSDIVGTAHVFWGPLVVTLVWVCNRLGRPLQTMMVVVLCIAGACIMHQFRAYWFFLYWENLGIWLEADTMHRAELLRMRSGAQIYRRHIVATGVRTDDGSQGTYTITSTTDAGHFTSKYSWSVKGGSVDVNPLDPENGRTMEN